MIYNRKTAALAFMTAIALALSSCSSLYSHEEEITAPPEATNGITSYEPPRDPDVPQFVETEATEPAPETLPEETASVTEASPAPVTETQQKDGSGMIIDDWRSDVDITPPAEVSGELLSTDLLGMQTADNPHFDRGRVGDLVS